MQPLISVIIPVYNREKYLRQCLDSVCNQTYRNLEIICLDNASTDHSLGILKEYAQKDPRIVVVAKPTNTGYGGSVNLGLSKASGDYIGIIESDDWASPTMFQTLAELAVQNPQAEIIRGDFYGYNPSEGKDDPECTIPAKLANRLLSPKENKEVMGLPRAIWSAIYKRSFLQQHKIVLNDAPNQSFQDTSFHVITWALAKYVYLTQTPLVHYRQDNPTSSIRRADHVFDIQKDFVYAEKFLSERALPFQAQINRLKLECYWWNIKRLSLDPSCEFILACASEVKAMFKKGPMDWSGISFKVRLRSWLWATSPLLFARYWRGYRKK